MKNINYGKYFKLFTINLIKGAIAYLITKSILGYSIFKPILIRTVNYGIENITFEPLTSTEYLFLICAPKEPGVGAGATVNGFIKGLWNGSEAITQNEVFNGFTIGQIIIFGITYGVIIYSLGLTQEYLIPPLMRQAGWKGYYTSRELNLQAIQNNAANTSEVRRRLTNIENKVEVLDIKTDLITNHQIILGQALDTILGRVDHARDALVALVGGLQNTLSTINNANLNPIRAMQAEMLTILGTMTSTLHAQSESALSPIALRTEMERLLRQFNESHGSVTVELQTVLENLRGQSSDVTQSLGNADERLQANITLLEGLLRQHMASGNVIVETVQNGIDLVNQQVEIGTQLVRTENLMNSNNVPAGPNIPSVNLDALITGVGASAIVETVTTQRSSASERLIEAGGHSMQVLDRIRPSVDLAQGHQYTIEQNGNELIIRLILKGNINIPVENIASNSVGNEIMKRTSSMVGNVITDRLTAMALNGILSVGVGAFGGALRGSGLPSNFTNAILRSISPGALPDVSIAEEKIESAYQVAKTFTKAAFNVMLK